MGPACSTGRNRMSAVSPAQESLPGGVQSPPGIPSVTDTGINESSFTAVTSLY